MSVSLGLVARFRRVSIPSRDSIDTERPAVPAQAVDKPPAAAATRARASSSTHTTPNASGTNGGVNEVVTSTDATTDSRPVPDLALHAAR